MGPFDVVTFDCYGTLIDWRTGIAEAVAGAAARVGARIDDERTLLRRYAELEAEAESGPWTPYREVLRRVALGLARSGGWALDGDAAGYLADSLPTWPPFADSARALERLRRDGVRVGILSNIDEDLLEDTLRNAGFAVDFRVTAEEVGAYKPRPAHFERAAGLVGDARWLHAAQSLFHDVAPARERGLPCAWIDRLGEPDPVEPPDWRFPDVATLAEAVVAARSDQRRGG